MPLESPTELKVEIGHVFERPGQNQRHGKADTLNPWPVWFEMTIAMAEGSYDNALDLAREILAIDPHFFYEVDPLANVYVATEIKR